MLNEVVMEMKNFQSIRSKSFQRQTPLLQKKHIILDLGRVTLLYML
jgi:hypothetical protein